MVTRRALVTGATGGLGRTLVPSLVAAGYEVRATGRDARIGALLGVPFVRADLVDDPLGGLVEGIDSVFHLAAISSPWGKYAAFEAANVTATTRLLAAAREAGVHRFVFTSTPSIYADSRDRLNLTERDPPAQPFANAYAATKYAAERLVLDAADATMTTVAIRPRAIVCPHDNVLLPRLLRAARSGRIRLPRGGAALIEVTDARDVAAALIAADSVDASAGQLFNISGGAPRALRDLLRTTFGIIERPLIIGTIGPRTAMAAAAVAEGIARLLPGRPEPPLTQYTVKTLAWSQTFDLTAARDLLGWSPRYSPEVALAHALGKELIHE